MDDEEVLLENDPLAIYLKNQEIQDFQTTKIHFQDDSKTICKINNEKKYSLHFYEGYQICFEKILKSELLLEEDYIVLDTYSSNNLIKTSNNYILTILPFISAAIYKYTNLKYIKILAPICSLPFVFHIYHLIKKQLKTRYISLLLKQLNTLTYSIKKCVRLVGELSATIGYYSTASINSSSFNNVYIRFAKEFYAILLRIIKLLAFNTSEFSILVPLTIENNFKYGLKQDLFIKENVNVSDLKVTFELYLLVQSDFIKSLGLSFCSYLWSDPNCDIEKILSTILPLLTATLKDESIKLENEYNILRNYGTHSKNNIVRSPKKYKNSPSNFMLSSLHNAELHFQQLLCKTRDLQSIVDKFDDSDTNESSQIVTTMLHEMDKQLISSKSMLESVTKYYNQIKNINTADNAIKVLMPQSVDNNKLKTVESQEKELTKQEKLTYELYIPKEGLDLSELEVDLHRPVFSVKDLNYSGVLLDELRTILKVRNPEIFEEQNKPQINSDSDDEDSFSRCNRRDIYRPTQPIGLAENLQTINQVLNARKNMIQCEEFIGSETEDEN